MTFAQFLKKLPKSGWTLIDGPYHRMLRRNTRTYKDQCPIEAVAGVNGANDSSTAHFVGKSIGLSWEIADLIIDASDDLARKDCREYRRRLLEHCGLTTKGKRKR